MTVLAEGFRTKLWFGTIERSGWFPTPLRGASVGAEGWGSGGTLLSGGGYQFTSFSSHKNFIFEWPTSSSREVAQLMKSYYDGSYGRGLIYFVDPLTYDMNILPARWADPSMTISNEAPSLVPGVDAYSSLTSAGTLLDLPLYSATYDLDDIGPTSPAILDDSNSVFVPIPDGYNLHLGAVYAASANAGVYYSTVSTANTVSGVNRLSPLTPSALSLHNTVISKQVGQSGIRLWVGKTDSSLASLTLTALSARLGRVGSSVGGPSGWVGGQGHSGCRFISPPTYVNLTGVSGGQVSFAASFREVGSWVRAQ